MGVINPDPLPLFSLPARPLPVLADAVAEREQAIEQTTDAADEAWKDLAYTVIRSMAYEMPRFTADDVWARLEKPREPRCLIGVLRRLVKDEYIEMARYEDDRPVTAPSRLRHAAPLQVWVSKVWRAT